MAKCAHQWFAIPLDPTPYQFFDNKNATEPDAYPNSKKVLLVEDGKVGGKQIRG